MEVNKEVVEDVNLMIDALRTQKVHPPFHLHVHESHWQDFLDALGLENAPEPKRGVRVRRDVVDGWVTVEVTAP